MSDGESFSRGLNQLLADGADRYRVVALYTLDTEHLPPPRNEDVEQPISALFEGSRFQRFYDRRPSMFPTSVAVQTVAGAVLGLPDGIQNCDATWTLLRFPSGLFIGALALAFDVPITDRATRSSTLVQLRHRLDAERSTLDLNGAQNAMGPDFHQVLLIPTMHAAEFGVDPLAEDAQRLVATKTSNVRPNFQSARMPRDPNRYFGTVAVLTPGASVLGGQDEHIQRACLVAAMQVMASLASLRSVFDRAYLEIGTYRMALTVHGTPRLDRQQATRLAEEVRALQLNLSYEVESQQEVRLAVPLLPVEDFHADLAVCLGISNASQTTSRMVERLTAALDAELGRLSLQEAADSAVRSRRVEAWASGLTVLATVSVPIALILAFLGSNVREVAAIGGVPRSIWDVRFLPLYAALILVPASAGLTAWALSRRVLRDEGSRPDRSRTRN
jgi:hypothetical protein